MLQHMKLSILGKITAVTIISAAAVFSLNVKDARAEVNYQTINVTSATIADTEASRAIQSALNQAEENATDSNPYRVVVDPGTYTLSSSLRIYSNTDLVLNGVTLTQETGSGYTRNILKVGDTSDENTGYFYKNITVEGGTLDENGNSATAIKGVHVKNFTLKNMTIENTHNSHLMEVAGIDGLTIDGCTFKNQDLDTKEKADITNTYEAIQLDIPVRKHIEGYRSEALQMKNVKIINCTFDKVPRGVGSHTTFLNVPFDNIQITNNKFSNLTSCAIQGMNWSNCTISNNTITNSPRGIALYSVRDFGTYLPSTAAKEDGPSPAYSDKYTKPSADQNINITNNTISCSGTDKYASYEPLAILLEGMNLASATEESSQGDSVPAGNYFISGAVIKGNTITTHGHGIRFVDARNSKIASNKITCTGKRGAAFYGIQLRKGSTSDSITKNSITNPSSNGIYLNTKSAASSITGNTIKSAGKYGIDIEQASATTIANNNISNPVVNGIYIFNGSKAGTIKSNTITSAEKYGIDLEKSSVTTIEKNKISSPGSNGIFVFNKSKVKTIKSNTISSPKKYGIGLDSGTVDLIQSNTITKPANNGINIYNNSFAKNIVSNKISSGKGYGIAVYSSQSKTKLKSNSIKSCKRGNTNL